MKSITTRTKIIAAVIIVAAAATAVTLATGIGPVEKNVAGTDELRGTITISGAFALYALAVKWGEEFHKLHPNVRFDVSAGGAGKGISDALGGLVDLGAVSRDLAPAEEEKGAYPIFVTKDAVVATINSSNPNIKEIVSHGVTRETFSRIFIDTTKGGDWSKVGFKTSLPIHPYTRSDASGAGETWAKYLGKKQEDLHGIGVFGDPGLLQAVKNDSSGIGYNNIGYAYDNTSHLPIDGITVVPIDINGNGTIDPEESFYGTLDQIIEAIAGGRYPSPPARDLCFVSKGKPVRPEVIAFLKWVLTDGQKFVRPNGYITLPAERLKAQLGRVTPNV